MKRKPATHLPLPLRRTKYQIFPAHPVSVLQAMDTSITHHGVETPTVWDDQGNLLDGWERENLCAKKSITCPREVRRFDNEADKFRFILTVNTHRRPCLSTQQKRAVIEAYLQGDPTIADNTLAQALGVSKNSVLKVRHRLEEAKKIRKVTKSRGKDGKLRPVKYTKRIITNTPKEFKKAQKIIGNLPDNCAGKMLDVTTATRRAKRNKKKDERERRIIEPLPGDAIQLYHCRFQDLEHLAGINAGTVKLIPTDIPYGADFLAQLDELAQFARRILADGGLFVCMCGHLYLNQVIRVFDNYLTWRWPLASTWDGNANLYHPLNVINQWKPLLLYSKGEWQPRGQWPDMIRVNSKEKEWHDWQQPLDQFERVVRYFSDPGDLVVDPLGGGFTTAVACFRVHRRCISCDVDPVCVSKGLERLESARNSVKD